MVDGVEYDRNPVSGDTPSASSSHYTEASPFPLNLSPFVPKTATEAGEDEDEDNSGGRIYQNDVHSGSGSQDEARGGVHERLLHEPSASPVTGTLFAKSSSGGIRWCKKCDAWKPDRCHHCRHCGRCTLKSEYLRIYIASRLGLIV